MILTGVPHYELVHTDEHQRVIGYTADLHYSPPAGHTDAQTLVEGDLPMDARVVSDRRPDGTCEQVAYESRTLDGFLGQRLSVLAEIQSPDENHYDPRNISSVTVTVLPAGGASAVPC